MLKLSDIAYTLASVVVCSLAGVIGYFYLRLSGLADATIVDKTVSAILDWALHLVL